MDKESMVGRRLYAKMIDVLMLFILVFLFDGFISQPVFSNITNIEEVKASYVTNSNSYNSIQDEYEIYIYDSEGNRKYNDNVSDEIQEAFLSDERIITLKAILVEEQEQILKNFVLRIMFSILIPAFLLYGIIPIFLREGKTIGRLIAKLTVINNNGKPIGWLKTLFRALASIVINIYLAIITLGIVPLISLIISILIKDNRSIVDLISGTKVIDGKIPYIYNENN